MFRNTFKYGGIAQLGERLLCKQEVKSSILFVSTNSLNVNTIVPWKLHRKRIKLTNEEKIDEKIKKVLYILNKYESFKKF